MALRSTRPVERRLAVEMLRNGHHSPADREAANAVLRAAMTEFPWVPGVVGDAGELLVRVLRAAPHLASVADLERTYAFSTVGVRRAVLGVLALRGDEASVDAVAHLIAESVSNGSLPPTSDGVLDPLVGAPTIARLSSALVSTMELPGWASDSSRLLVGMLRHGMLDMTVRHDVSSRIAGSALTLMDDCDRGTPRSVMGNAGRGDPHSVDPFRRDRDRIQALAEVLSFLDTADASRTLLRLLAAVDPVVSAAGALGLIARGELVADERLVLMARDPRARCMLMRGLTRLGRQFLLPMSAWSAQSVAEAEMVCWLSSPSGLRCAPDEIEHRGEAMSPIGWGAGPLHLFAFRFRPPHHTAQRDWMFGAVGPWDSPSEMYPRAGAEFAAHSLYEPFDESDRVQHLDALRDSLVSQRGA
ncbi:MAG: hypothetical protein ACK5O2_00060 [Microthrixaceae bacterium]